MKAKLYFLLLVINLSFCHAEEIFQAKTGQSINATISKTDLTRVQVSGFSIVKAFTATSVKVKKDQATGQLYILPSPHTKTFSLFIADSNGDTFNLILTPTKNKVGDSIVILPDLESLKRYKKEELKANFTKKQSPYERTLIDLIQIMYLGLNEDNGISYSVTNSATVMPLYKDLTIILTSSYSNDTLTGYVYRVTNTGKERIDLDESDFYTKGALAVSIETPILNVNQSTRVFVVNDASGIN